ncbi:MAG: tetratricopeptide repeat protein [Clostridia bacterium]|nr:tetratricopeptide repeat protein [Clostridia bacterium]
MKRKILFFVKIGLGVSILASTCFYVLNMIIAHSSPWKYIYVFTLFAVIPFFVLIKLFYDDYARIIDKVKAKFATEISDAFDGKIIKRHTLLISVFLFNKGKNRLSIILLTILSKKCIRVSDYRAVELFRALNYTALKKEPQAMLIYDKAIKNGYGTSAIFNNLGHLYSKEELSAEAHKNYDLAIHYDPKNITAYHNKAQLYFKENNYEKAIELSEKALDINPKFSPSTTLLAIIYALQGDNEKAIEAKGRAIENGESASNIDRTIKHYKDNPPL